MATVFISYSHADKKHAGELSKLLEALKSGDQVFVWKMDRLTRSLRHLLNLSDDLESKG